MRNRTALGCMGPEVRSAATAILGRLATADPDDGVRAVALDALRQVAPKEGELPRGE